MPIPLAVFDAYVRCIERQKAELWKQLDLLETGQIFIGERKFGRPVWADTTHREITRLKAAVVEYEGILASIKYEKYRYEPPPRRPKGEKRASAG
jgi:hypothetical protein